MAFKGFLLVCRRMGFLRGLALAAFTIGIVALVSTIEPVEALEPFIAEVKYFAGNFAPRGFAFCDGELLPIAQNTALFAVIGNTYGGDGRTTVGLPNMQGKFIMHPGRGPGLTPRNLGESSGTTTETLTEAQLPQHAHNIVNPFVAQLKAAQAPGENALAESSSLGLSFARMYSTQTPNTEMHTNSIMFTGTTQPTGGSQSHSNMPPYLGVNCIIALQGVFPSRN